MTKNILITFLSIIIIQFAEAQTKKKTFHRYYFNAGYIFSVNANNSKPAKPLFAGNGYSLGFAHGWELSPYWGLMTHLSYNFGNVNKNRIADFAKTFSSTMPLSTKQAYTNWSQAQLTTGFLISPIKKIPLFFEVTGGVFFVSKPNSIVIQQNDNGILGKTLYEAKEKSLGPAWGIRVFYTITKPSKKIHAYISTGISNLGYTVTASSSYVSSNCHGAPCCKCWLAGCNPCAAEAASKKGKK